MIFDRRASTSTRSGFRSVRYRVGGDKSPLTADSGAIQKFRIKRQSMYDTTMAQTGQLNTSHLSVTLNLGQNPKLKQQGYLESFNSMMQTRQIKKNNQDQSWLKTERIKMPILPDLQGSQFNLMDQIKMPIDFIKGSINDNKKQLKRQRQEVDYLRIELDMLKANNIRDIESIHKQGIDYIEMMRGAVRKNQINQQQFKLRIKKQLHQLKEGHLSNIDLMKVIHNKNQQLQESLYSSKPFQLQQNEQFGADVYF